MNESVSLDSARQENKYACHNYSPRASSALNGDTFSISSQKRSISFGLEQ